MSDRRRKRQEYRGVQKEKNKSAGQRPGGAARPVWPIVEGWKVYTSDQAALGTVAGAPEDEAYFTVRRGLLLSRATLYIPTRFVRGSGDGRVMLRLTKSQALALRQQPSGRRAGAHDEDDALATAGTQTASSSGSTPGAQAAAHGRPARMTRKAPPPTRATSPARPTGDTPRLGLTPANAADGTEESTADTRRSATSWPEEGHENEDFVEMPAPLASASEPDQEEDAR